MVYPDMMQRGFCTGVYTSRETHLGTADLLRKDIDVASRRLHNIHECWCQTLHWVVEIVAQ